MGIKHTLSLNESILHFHALVFLNVGAPHPIILTRCSPTQNTLRPNLTRLTRLKPVNRMSRNALSCLQGTEDKLTISSLSWCNIIQPNLM